MAARFVALVLIALREPRSAASIIEALDMIYWVIRNNVLLPRRERVNTRSARVWHSRWSSTCGRMQAKTSDSDLMY